MADLIRSGEPATGPSSCWPRFGAVISKLMEFRRKELNDAVTDVGGLDGCGRARGSTRGRRPAAGDEAAGPGRVLQAPERPQGRALARHHHADGLRGRLLQHRVPKRAEEPHRLRPPLRAHDVPGFGQPRQDGVHPARRVKRRAAQRLDAVRLHQLLPGRALARARAGALGRGRPHARAWRSTPTTSRTSRRS